MSGPDVQGLHVSASGESLRVTSGSYSSRVQRLHAESLANRASSVLPEVLAEWEQSRARDEEMGMLLAPLVTQPETPEELFAQKELLGVLDAALDEKPYVWRYVLFCHAREFSFREIGEDLGKTWHAVARIRDTAERFLRGHRRVVAVARELEVI